MSWEKEPVEKLALAVRKNVRDNFESKKPEHEAEIARLIGAESFTINVNTNLVFAYAADSYAQNNTGSCINGYFVAFIEKLKKYTDDAKDAEAMEALRKVVKQRSITLVPTDKVSYCGVEIKDGEIRLLFKHSYLGTNISDVATTLPVAVDDAIDALGENDLPVVARRAIKEHLDPAVKELQEKLKKMLNKDYKFEYDILASIRKLKEHPDDINWYKQYINQRVPEWTARYFKAAVEKLEKKNFGKDEMLQEAFVESTETGIIRFELVDKLKHGTYNDTIFEGGEYKLQVTPKYFGSNVDDIGRDVVERL